MGLARKKKTKLFEGGNHDLFKNHKWPRLSCVHYTKWHFVLKCTGTIVQGQPPDHSPPQSHKQRDGGSAAPLPARTPGQATVISFIFVTVLSVAFCSCPSSPVSAQQHEGCSHNTTWSSLSSALRIWPQVSQPAPSGILSPLPSQLFGLPAHLVPGIVTFPVFLEHVHSFPLKGWHHAIAPSAGNGCPL